MCPRVCVCVLQLRGDFDLEAGRLRKRVEVSHTHTRARAHTHTHTHMTSATNIIFYSLTHVIFNASSNMCDFSRARVCIRVCVCVCVCHTSSQPLGAPVSGTKRPATASPTDTQNKRDKTDSAAGAAGSAKPRTSDGGGDKGDKGDKGGGDMKDEDGEGGRAGSGFAGLTWFKAGVGISYPAPRATHEQVRLCVWGGCMCVFKSVCVCPLAGARMRVPLVSCALLEQALQR